MYFDIALIAYIIDRIFGEFRFIRHPVVLMGDYIQWFEKQFYKDSIFRGVLLTLSLTSIVGAVGYCCHSTFVHIFPEYISTIILGIITSTTIASKMLYDSVKDIILHPQNIKFLVSRDTENLSDSDINKAAIETYAENLSDGVIAPLFYLILFGLWGAFVYKAVNTLDSMVGYRNKRYEKFGKFSAKVDDTFNYIPARVTAILINILFYGFNHLRLTWREGKKHESLNAGYPITAMALNLHIRLGGDTAYFGKIKPKPFFGTGRKNITKADIQNALKLQSGIDRFIVLFLGLGIIL
ncbi:Adenosylcobinamide-phosphate synthase [hydrothermal vent metagenome]|uniref:Adenosylcobinamide-phosphate synthase n=1 Tax=hydrothermal vent metagenome TaxID=652676 RepID=A0A1W1CYB5_9ZZZZ